jgi:hypothetical protein
MDHNMVLSLSPDQRTLASREVTLRSSGMKVISVMSPIQARFEIEMGRCWAEIGIPIGTASAR